MTAGRRVAWAVVLAAAAIAVLADAIAGDRPLALRSSGRTSLPVLGGATPGELTGDALRVALARDDWAVWPPIAHAPDAVRGRGEIAPLAPPSRRHLLGTDDRGRDVAARLVHGARTSLTVAGIAAVLATALALALALIAARLGGVIDAGVRALCDTVAAAPPILAVIAVQGLVGARGLAPVIALIALPRAADTARLVRGSLRAALAMPFVEAARAAGAGPGAILVRHALPHAASVAATAAAITAATAVLSEAALSFLGVGVTAPIASWGELLAQATANDLRWWLAVPAGMLVTVMTAALLALARPSR